MSDVEDVVFCVYEYKPYTQTVLSLCTIQTDESCD